MSAERAATDMWAREGASDRLPEPVPEDAPVEAATMLEDEAETGRPPETEAEKIIADIWSELLGVEDPPADVTFFNLGGYSLGLMRVAAQLQEAFRLTVPVADLFERTTIAAQAELVEQLYAEQLAELAD
ncbi:phosphopantetheine-binding protein [Nonomuraea sp. NPDC052116]|uniref:phosphopantetheine-binding protein n=1 Tax=Nonomuraea sp. NPDC052116 TaxID=3155665 RepID=UPI003440DEE3